MTEWEKLSSGLVYNDFDDEMKKLRNEAKLLFRRYNQTGDQDSEERKIILNKLFKRMGKHVLIEPDFHCEFGKNISIGENVFINFGCVILDCADVVIGNNVLFGPNIGLYPVNHSLNAKERIAGACTSSPIHIEDNVWLGGDVKVLAGVTIGKNSVVGAGSVVTKDIPANVLAFGNPCQIIRPLTEKDKTNYFETH